MNQSKMWLSIEKMLIDMGLDELYLFQGAVKHRTGLAKLIDKIHRMIAYRENMARNAVREDIINDEFEDIVRELRNELD